MQKLNRESQGRQDKISLSQIPKDNVQVDTAIPFIMLDQKSKQFKVSQQAEEFLSKLKNPVGVLTIVGKYRTGKSLFLNRVMLKKNKTFKVSPTINSCTKGLWLWRGTLKQTDDQNEQQSANRKQILIIDSEGFGATQQTDAYNNKILLFALLLSSYFIYNSVGSIDENSLSNLSVIANLANQIQAKNNKNEQNIEQNFPSFMWLIRDFTLNLVNKDNKPIKPKQYLENALQIQKGTSNQIESKNKIRRMMKYYFSDRDCQTLVRPVETQDMLQGLDTLEEEDFRETFKEQSSKLRRKIISKVKPKTLKKTTLNGQMLCQLAKNYVQVVNSNSLPNFESSYKHLIKVQIANFKKSYLRESSHQIKNFILKITKPYLCNQSSSKKFQNDKANFRQLNKSKQQFIDQQQLTLIQKLDRLGSASSLSLKQYLKITKQLKSNIREEIQKQFQEQKVKQENIFLSLIQNFKKQYLNQSQVQKTNFGNTDESSNLFQEKTIVDSKQSIKDKQSSSIINFKFNKITDIESNFNRCFQLIQRKLIQRFINLVYVNNPNKDTTEDTIKCQLLNKKSSELRQIQKSIIFLQQLMQKYLIPFKFNLYSKILQQRFQEKQNQVKELNQNIINYKQKISLQQQSINNLQINLQRAQQRNQTLQSKIRDLIGIQRQKQIQISEQKEHGRQFKSHIEKLNAQIAYNKSLYNEIKIKQQELQNEYNQIKESYTFTDKQLNIVKFSLQSKINQIRDNKQFISKLQQDIGHMEQRLISLSEKNQFINKQKEQLYQKYLITNQQNSQKILNLQKENIQIKTILKQRIQSFSKLEAKHQQMLSDYKGRSKQDYQTKTQLTQANALLSQIVQSLQSRVTQFEQKALKLKQYKKSVLNSSSIQCRYCDRFFMTGVFLTHLNVCNRTTINNQDLINENRSNQSILSSNQNLKHKSQDTISVKITNVEVVNKFNKNGEGSTKPCTVYTIQCFKKYSKQPMKWKIKRQFKEMCELSQNIHKQLSDNTKISDSSFICQPLEFPDKNSLSFDRKKQLLEKYLNDLGNAKLIENNSHWVHFIQQNQNDIFISQSQELNERSPLQEKKSSKINSLKRQSSNGKSQKSKSFLQSQIDPPIISNHTPEQFFKVWEQGNMRSKASSTISVRKRKN